MMKRKGILLYFFNLKYLDAILLYRKFFILSEMVYNKHESKNGMTKERRYGFAMTLSMVLLVHVGLHYLTIEKWLLRVWFYP